MKADVQYNDFVGTAAADISDHTDLNKYLESKGVDINRYNSIGVRFYSSYNFSFSASIICIDKKKSTAEKQHIVLVSFEKNIDRDDFFDLFKRFNVVITSQFGDYENKEIDERITIEE